MVPSVSVLVPIYNAASYLRQCLDSICKQTLTDMEIICINDGSTDDSPEIIREYAEKDQRIKIIDKSNTGYGHSINVGIEAARGEYIGIVESDDFVEPDMFEKLYRAACRHDSEIVKSNFWFYWSDRGDVFQEIYPEIPYGENFAPRNFPKIFSDWVFLWTGIYRKRFLLANDITFRESPGASFQDVGFTIKAMACAQKVQLIPNAYYHYRQDNENSSVHSEGKVFCVSDEFKEVWNYLAEHEETMDAVKYALPPAQFQRLAEGFGRIDERYKLDYIFRAEADFKKLREDGLLKREYWKPEKWEAFRTFGQTYRKELSGRKKRQWMRQGLSAIAAQTSHLYIYGAGVRGKAVYKYLHGKRLSVASFIITETNESTHALFNLPVMSIDQLEIGADDIILIAIKDPGIYEAIRELETREIGNYIAVDDELYAALCEKSEF